MTAALPHRPDRPRRPVALSWDPALDGRDWEAEFPDLLLPECPGMEPDDPRLELGARQHEQWMARLDPEDYRDDGEPWDLAVAGPQPAPTLPEQLACVRAVRELLAGIDGYGEGATDPVRIDLLTATEELKGAITAAQARVTVAFAESQQAAGQAAGHGAREVDRGIGPQLALARRSSASTADRHRSLAASLTTVLPHTLAALTRGAIGEAHAHAMQTATTGLSAEVRMAIDSRLAGRLPILTPKQLGAAATHLAAEFDVEALVAKHRLAVTNRGAWTRPAPDGMAYLTVLGPLPEIVGAVAALHAHATAVVAGHAQDDPAEDRTHAQVMADTALTRLSGRAVGQAQPVAVTLVMTPDNLYGHHTNPYNGAGDTSTDAGAASQAGSNGSGRRLALVRDPSADDGTTDGSTIDDSTIDGAPVTNSATGGTPSASTDRDDHEDSGRADHEDSGRADHEDTDPDTAAGNDTAAGKGTGGDTAKDDSSTKFHRPGTRARCAPTATPVRIVGHGPIAAPLARAWLLAGCDTTDDDVGRLEHPDHPPPDHLEIAHDTDPEPMPSPKAGRADRAENAPPGDNGLPDPEPTPGPAAQSRPDQETGAHTPPASTPASTASPHPAEVWLRRAFTSADGRDLIALESTARLFPPQLRALLVLRDDKCRIPFCDAPIRHADHITPVVAGGPTTLGNGQGLSARCNYTKDLAGYSTRTLSRADVSQLAAGPQSDRNTLIARQAGPDTHVTAVTTPTGHTYLSSNPPATGWAAHA